MGYAGFLVTAAAWALAASFAPEIGGFACVVLLAAALHNCWTMTLIIVKAARGGFLESSACLFE